MDNEFSRWICLISAMIGALCLTVQFSGGPLMMIGIFSTTFAIMTAARYPYQR